MILIPNSDIEEARMTAEKIRKFFETKTYDDGIHSTTVTISIGVASFGRHQPGEPKKLIALADKALYRAKSEGRNRVMVYGDESMGVSKK